MGRKGWGGHPRARSWGKQSNKDPKEKMYQNLSQMLIELSERARWIAQEEHFGDCIGMLEARYLISPHRNLFGTGALTQLAIAIAQRGDPYPNVGLNQSAHTTYPSILDATKGFGSLSHQNLLERAQVSIGATLNRALRLGAVVDTVCSFWEQGILIEHPSQEGDLEQIELFRWSELKEVKMSTRSAQHKANSPRKAFLLIPKNSYTGEGKILASERFLELLKPFALQYQITVTDCGSTDFSYGKTLNEQWIQPPQQDRA